MTAPLQIADGKSETLAATDADLTVLYDGACPLCDREIGFYRRRAGAERVRWVDVSATTEQEVAPGLSKVRALARFHVVDARGDAISGGAAFARLWEALPAFRPLGRLFRFALLAWALDRAYDGFLRVRPWLQARARARAADEAVALPRWLVRALRSDHAGEAGAVFIYRGILAVARDEEVRRFAERHLATERKHLALMETVLPRRSRSLFLSVWRVAGFLTGALPALAGRKAVFATIDAVETFVDRHYGAQVERLASDGTHEDILALLERCRLDEVEHRDEARVGRASSGAAGPLIRAWCRLVGAGSAAAVALAERA